MVREQSGLTEQDARAQLCTVGTWLYERKLVAANDGNLSVRLDDGSFLITPSGVCKGRMNPSMIVRCAPDGSLIDGGPDGRKPSSEVALHARVYALREDVGAIVHAHPPVATAFAACGIDLSDALLPEAVVGLGSVPVCPFALPSTDAVAESIVPFAADHQAVLLANHGALAWGGDLEEAFARMETVEQMAVVQAQAALLGGGNELSESDREVLKGLRTYYADRAATDGPVKARLNEVPVQEESVALREDGRAVRIVDQTQLPERWCTVDLETPGQVRDAIATLQVRGAPAIGVAAAYGLFVCAQQAAADAHDVHAFRAKLAELVRFLNSARPTAVNLAWALERMESAVACNNASSVEAAMEVLLHECRAIHAETVAASNEIARLGAELLNDGDGVITHCNAGPLACLGYGTGQGPLFAAHEQGKRIHVFVDETRPLLQGARITSMELTRAGIDATLICDNMASVVMSEGRVAACMVGCDRVAANGDVANKIGTAGLAILAHHFGIPFYVLGPTSTIDLSCATGKDIPIELRDGSEIRSMHYARPMAPDNVACYNPSFDVTPHELVSAIITERGIAYPPYTASLAELF